MRCNYEVPRMILLQAAYLYTDSLLRGVTFEVLPLSSCAFSPTMLPLFETFWNPCCGTAFSAVITLFFGCLQNNEISIPLRQTSWKQPEVIQSQIRGIGWVFHFSNRFLCQKLLDRECCALWAEALLWWRVQSFGWSSGLFVHTASHNHFNIST
jgi:hypothetical protein